jgi:signal transduction histidine kinase
MLRPAGGGIDTIVDLTPVEAGAGVQLAAGLDVAALLVPAGDSSRGATRATAEEEVACALRGADGAPLTRDAGPAQADGRNGALLRAEAPIRAEGWSAPFPWTLACARGQDAAIALIEPLVTRYRLTIALNALVMILAILLGAFAIQQMRRRERLEGKAREESRVREVERQLFHAERLTTVGRLAAGMAHEINNPLEGMSNYIVLASEALERSDVSAARRHLAGVRSGLEAAAGVVRQILMHADPAVAPRAALGLGETVMQAVDLVRSRAEFETIRFQCDVPAAGPAVMGNQVLLGQVFLNLALNACEAQPRGGEVRVAVSCEEGGWAAVEFADRGPGIAPGDAERIFEPFYSTKGSTGLGLSICHAIARQHGGTLSASGRPGGGASFVFRLPGLGASETHPPGGTTHAEAAR